MPLPILVATLMRPHGTTGVQTYTNSLLRYLPAAGQEVALATPFGAPRWQLVPVFGLRRLLHPLSGTAGVWWYRHWHAHFLRAVLRRRLAGGQPCIVYAQCPPSAAAALAARRSEKQRVVLAVHFNVSQADEWAGKGDIAPGGRLFRSIRRFEEETLARVDGIVYVSRHMQEQVEARVPAARGIPARALPNFLAEQPARPVAPKPDAELITIGTLEPRKNQAFLLRVLAAARDLGSRLRLDIVGDGPDRAALVALAAQLDLQDQVRFLGFRPDASALLEGHLAYVHAATMESLSIALVEGLRAGLPLFAAPRGGVPEVFDEGVQGRYWDLEDASRSARILTDTLADRSALTAMGQAGRQRFVERFSEAAVGNSLIAFLQMLAQ